MTDRSVSRRPGYDIARILRKKRDIEGDIYLAELIGTQPEGEGYEELVRRVARHFTKECAEAIEESLIEFIGQPLTPQLLSDMAWRLAGNVRALRARMPVLPWRRQQREEWVPLQVTSSKSWITKRGRRGFMLQFRVLAGSACPMVIEKFWSREFCAVVARRIGFTRFHKAFPWQHGGQFVGLRLMALLSPETSKDAPDFSEVGEASGSLLAYNRRLLRARAPITRQCPQDYPTSVSCHLCPVGQDHCGIAVHAVTYVHRLCEVCGLDKLHDPATHEDRCIDCQYQRMKESAES